MDAVSTSGTTKPPRSIRRWFWQRIQQVAEWAHDGTPIWYMHRQWSPDGILMNYLAKMHERANRRLLGLDVADLRTSLQHRIAIQSGRIGAANK